jgi:hypothetical protein
MIKLNGVNVKYSENEQMLFGFVPKDGRKITSEELLVRRKKVKRWPIANPRNSISSTMRTLSDKIESNREPFQLCRSAQLGPYPTEYWLERSR